MMRESALTVTADHPSPIWRAAAVVICAVIGGLSFVNSVVNITKDTNPATALRFSPDSAAALSSQADVLLAKVDIQKPDILSGLGLTRQSLIGQAINSRALRQLGFIADTKGDIVQARRLMILSTRVSRRDLAAQLWLIEDGVRSGDIGSTLSHYDMALRTNGDSAKILFPILSAALVDDTVQAAFAPYIKANPIWLQSFLGYAIGVGDQPAAIATTVQKAGGLPDQAQFDLLKTQLLQQLITKGAFDQAAQYYLSLKRSQRDLLQSTRFEKSSVDQAFAPISWQLLNSAGIDAAFESVEGGFNQQLHVSASSGERAVIVRKLLYLPQGAYQFSQQLKPIRYANGAMAHWLLNCISGTSSRGIWQSNVNGAALVIPQNCNTQSLELVVAGGADQAGAELVISLVTIKP
jgi:hypothetical protein